MSPASAPMLISDFSTSFKARVTLAGIGRSPDTDWIILSTFCGEIMRVSIIQLMNQIRQAGEQVVGKGNCLLQHPRAKQEQYQDDADHLRDKDQRRFVDLCSRLHQTDQTAK